MPTSSIWTFAATIAASLCFILSASGYPLNDKMHHRRANSIIDKSGTKNSIMSPTDNCEQLATAFSHVYHRVILPLYDRDMVLGEIKMVTGINPEDQRQLIDFACGLRGVHSVTELGKRFRLPSALSRQLYGELMDEFSRCGGVRGCKSYMQMMNDLVSWVTRINYPSWPLHTTYQDTSRFLRKMATEYGADFLSGPGVMSGNPQAPILVTEATVDILARSFAEARSLGDLIRLTGLPADAIARLDDGLQVLVRAGSFIPYSNAALEELITAADQMGLLYLPEK